MDDPEGSVGARAQVVEGSGLTLRAEPVAALYEQGRCHAVPVPELEEVVAMGAGDEGSLDRADVLVWAVMNLLVGRTGEVPRARWV